MISGSAASAGASAAPNNQAARGLLTTLNKDSAFFGGGILHNGLQGRSRTSIRLFQLQLPEWQMVLMTRQMASFSSFAARNATFLLALI
jgi:hypothetical protein